ncbi:FG-GAP-like repeat-containing protein [Oligoflexia bacterium]|nr:FG-GAP-like repeat-containing protein [Oligoflexia bacterium]
MLRVPMLFIVLLWALSAHAAPVQQPQLLKQIDWLETSWFASPAIYDLDGDGENELIGTYYSIFVWDKNFNLLDKMSYKDYHLGRIYAPAVIADLDSDGVTEIVVGGSKGRVAAYEWKNGALSIKTGWPVITYDGTGMDPEVRSLAAGDLNHDGQIEIIAANTQTDTGEPQVYVISPNGQLYQPSGISWTAWPRYNQATGTGNDADANGQGNKGYGAFGENVGIGNLDDDPELEIVVTFDNHQINVFNHDGTSMLASDFFTNRSSTYSGQRLNWGQFIRWYDADVETNHYHLHQGDWPHPSSQKWCQWTASPPNVIDVDGDGKNEVVGISNIEMDEPYDTKHHSVMVLEGNYGDGSRSARRLAGWESLPGSGYPQSRAGHSWYPPSGIPAPTTVNLVNDSKPEIIAALNDGNIYMFAPEATELWRYDYRHGRDLMYASEVLVADLNQDDVGELIFTTYGDPDDIKPGVPHGYLVILDAAGNLLFDLELPVQGTNGNGKGAPAAPTLGDLDRDGDLELVVQTFGGKCFVYSVPGSSDNALIWPTARGNYLRQGSSSVTSTGGALNILTTTLVEAHAATAYSSTLIAAGGTAPYVWELTSGKLPSGLTLASDGTLSGTPTASGSFAWIVKVTDAAKDSDTQDLTLTVKPAAVATTVAKARFEIFWKKPRKDRYTIKGSFSTASNPLQTGVPVTVSLGSQVALSAARLVLKKQKAVAKAGKSGKASFTWNKSKKLVRFTVVFKRGRLSTVFGIDQDAKAGSLTLPFALELNDQAYGADINLTYRKRTFKTKRGKKASKTVGKKT